MIGWPDKPVIYEVNTAIWLGDLARAAGHPVTLADVPASGWDAVTPPGVERGLADGRVGAQPGRPRAGERERRAAGVVPGRAARPAAPRRDGIAVLCSPVRRRRLVRRPGGAGRGAGHAGRPRHPAAAGLRAQPRRARPPLGDEPPGAVHSGRRTRPRGGSSGLGGRRRPRAGARPRPVLPALARRRTAQRVLARPARGDRRDPRRHRQSVRRDPLRHGHADDQRCLRQDVGRPGRARTRRGVLAGRHRGPARSAPRDRADRRGLLGHGVGPAAAGLRLLLRQAALRPHRRRRRGRGP